LPPTRHWRREIPSTRAPGEDLPVMAVLKCPIGQTYQIILEWPPTLRSLADCNGLAQVRDEESADGDLLIDGTVTIDENEPSVLVTLAAGDTIDMDEGSRGYLDVRLEWDDGQVFYPLGDEIVQIEFTPTITREA